VALFYTVWIHDWRYPFANVAGTDPTCHRYNRVAAFTMTSHSII
jgi:hypothetical protein